MGRVDHIFCHPIKSVGRLSLNSVELTSGKTMPDDRVWAVAHETSQFDTKAPVWANCGNFTRCAKAPELQAVSISNYVAGSDIALRHPDSAPFQFNPTNPAEHAGLIEWLSQFVPENRAQPAKLVQAPDRGMTDSPFPSVSVLSLTSLRELSNAAGSQMAMERFRGNFWLDGLEPWEEFNWIGRTLRLGGSEALIKERIGRCSATTVNPDTGKRNIATLELLKENWSHTDFGVYGEVVKSGAAALQDKAEIL